MFFLIKKRRIYIRTNAVSGLFWANDNSEKYYLWFKD